MKLTFKQLYIFSLASTIVTFSYLLWLTIDKPTISVIMLIVMISTTAAFEHMSGKEYIREGRV